MGLGKSAQAIEACNLVNAETVLVVCRAVARGNWRNEFNKFSTRDPKVTITSYEGLQKILDGPKEMYDVCIIDESHYVKEPNAVRTKAVLGKTGAVHCGRQTYLLTGTPTPNHVGELWTILYTFGRTRINFDGFIERYCTYRVTSYGRQITGTSVEPDKIAELKRMLDPIVLRRTKEDVNLELPPISYSDLIVKPGRVELLMCQSFQKYVVPNDRTDDLIADLEREIGVVKGIVNGHFTIEAMLGLQAASKSIMTLRRYNSMQKVEPVVELVSQELDAKEYGKIVIFAIHRDTIVSLQQKLAKKYGAVLVFGGSKPSRIDERIDKFQNSKRCKVFIAQLHAAGTSITLTAADQVLFVDQDWVPGNNAQAAARCHRIGQKRPVTVRCVALENSIDQHISNILRKKTSEINSLMAGAMSGQPEKPNINSIL